MKKQLFLITVILFTSVFTFAQHDPPTCSGSSATPAVGVSYPYVVTISGEGYDGEGTYNWFVTQNVNLLSSTPINNNTGEFIATGAGAYASDNSGKAAGTINIEWTSAALATGKPYYLVVNYKQANSAANPTCSTNNVKVYRIVPMNAFYLAVDNITTQVCPPEVVSAIITEGDDPTVTYDYGTSTLQFTITAGGYTGEWDAQIDIQGTTGTQTIESVTWTSDKGTTTSGTLALSGGYYAGKLPSYTDKDGGVATITVTVVIDNNTFEHTSKQDIAIAVDGSYTSGTSTFPDLSNVNGDCTPETAFADKLTQTIMARPNVAPSTPAAFVTQN